jgi:isoleucyl-tRNA synthetase
MPRYRAVEAKVDLPGMERRILDFWREERVFEASLELRRGSPEWVFYDGPPTANNRPHIGHVEARTFKDLYPRYRTMTGHYVHRKAGWDCHGLPVEVEIEKRIGTKSKRDIEAFGVTEFVRLCRESVKRYVEDWKRVSHRMAFWIDMEDAYWTMDPEYVQSVWWALKRLHGDGLLYRDFRVTPYCPRCGTGLSDAEVAQGYQTVADPSVYVRFPVIAGAGRAEGADLVGWTTTPWTLVSNLGLAIDPDERYVRLSAAVGRDLIVARARLDTMREVVPPGTPAEVLDEFPGSELVGATYEPPFPNVDGDTHRVVATQFVRMNEGTGVVHMAPAFGAEDLEVGRREGWPLFNPVDEEGRFTDEAPQFLRGRFVKEADPDIIEDLRAREILVWAGTQEHTYPMCWRCDTPLLYYARPAWYVRTTARKADLLEANDGVHWYPAHIKEGRYGDWLRNNVDWSLSRERYWGTPLPIWTCEREHLTVVGSLQELSDLTGRDLLGIDPHRPVIDDVTLACPQCGGEASRVPEVIDAWFDSGAMPYAQWGYAGPDSGAAEVFRRRFPADFIAEGLDQTRGWFYSLMAEGVLLFGESAYRNVVCHGLVMDEGGRRMSKRLGNVIEPEDAFDRFGADAVRWFMIASGSPWSARRASFGVIADVVRQFLLTLWNVYAFYVTYANVDEPDLSAAPPPGDRTPLDRWALSRLHGTVASVREAIEEYDATGAARRIEKLVDDLSNWYVRRSRRRFWDPARAGGREEQGKVAAHSTLGECLVTLSGLLAPLTPFIAEEIYRNLVAEQEPNAPLSVHLTDFPVAQTALVDPGLEEAMELARSLVSLGRTVRTEARVKVRQPLARAVVSIPGDPGRLSALLPLVAEELNVKEVVFSESTGELTHWRAKPNFRTLGPRLGRQVSEVAVALAEGGPEMASDLARGRAVELSLDEGRVVSITPHDVELVQATRRGWGVASEGPVTVALDLEVDETLRREGLVRELIHHVQALRRSVGLDVTDRIALAVRVEEGADLRMAVEDHRERVAAEVLATWFVLTSAEEGEDEHEVVVDGIRVGLSVRRA